MKKIIATGKTIEEAVDSALKQLGTTKENVKINIIEKPGKKLFGLMGTKEAVVEVEVINDADPLESSKTFLNDLFKAMKLSVHIEQFNHDDYTVYNLVGRDLGILIGRRGQTLDALQYLVSIIANKNTINKKRIILDAENYRSKRKAILEDLADKLANKVLRINQDVVLEPMTPLERKIIHTQLQNHPDIETYSIGEEPNRKVVITLRF